jgi:hypothetical protein
MIEETVKKEKAKVETLNRLRSSAGTTAAKLLDIANAHSWFS